MGTPAGPQEVDVWGVWDVLDGRCAVGGGGEAFCYLRIRSPIPDLGIGFIHILLKVKSHSCL